MGRCRYAAVAYSPEYVDRPLAAVECDVEQNRGRRGTMHKTYRDFYLARARSAVAAAKAATGISHRGVKGEIREILVRDLFRPLLPADMGVGTGEIISHTDRSSTQQDIVLYDRRILPPILFEECTGLFPIESVLYVIEIKSKLDAGELSDSHDAAMNFLTLDLAPGRYDPKGIPVHHLVTKPIYAIFAFGTDLSGDGKTEVERYTELLARDQRAQPADGPPIRVICVVDRGYWYWLTDHWETWKPSYELEEVLGFVSGVMNTYKSVAATRLDPRLGRYLF
jgi:hypothetical protein